MIGAVYGHLKEYEDDGEKLPIAVFQFFNKRDFKIITDYDLVSILFYIKEKIWGFKRFTWPISWQCQRVACFGEPYDKC